MKQLWNFGWGLYKKYEEGINYLIFGFAAFVLSVALFWLFVEPLGMQELIGNFLSWVICVVFTYFTNRIFVFKSQNKDAASVRAEFVQFVGARLGTLILEQAVIFVGITLMHGNTMLVKLIGQILVIVSNYVLSKLWIFKEK